MENKKYVIAVSITLSLILIVTVAFAALSSNLNISFGNVTQNALSWKIGFRGDSVVAIFDGTSTTGSSCGTASITPSTVTISDTTLSKPGDKCTYPLTIENSGDIAATLTNIATTAPTSISCDISGSTMVCGNITYQLTTTANEALSTGVTLNKKDKYNIKLVVSYTGTELNSSEVTQNNAKFTLTYTQSANRSGNVPEDVVEPVKVCKRATTLHTEECSKTSDGCYATGYYLGGTKNKTTITYGSLGTAGKLASGDAFDCDVNGDGTYDPATERFYYMSGLDGDNTSNTAVLVYYNNFANGGPNDTASIVYDSSNHNYDGPTKAYEFLPTTSQWSNVSLTNQTRQIYAENGTTETIGGSLPVFEYTDRAARMISYKEVNKACGITVGSLTNGELDNCEYLMEHTTYSSGSSYIFYYLETPRSSFNNIVFVVSGASRNLTNGSAMFPDGVRPVIEVSLDDIDY